MYRLKACLMHNPSKGEDELVWVLRTKRGKMRFAKVEQHEGFIPKGFLWHHKWGSPQFPNCALYRYNLVPRPANPVFVDPSELKVDMSWYVKIKDSNLQGDHEVVLSEGMLLDLEHTAYTSDTETLDG